MKFYIVAGIVLLVTIIYSMGANDMPASKPEVAVQQAAPQPQPNEPKPNAAKDLKF